MIFTPVHQTRPPPLPQSLSMIKYWRTKHVVVNRPDLVEVHTKRKRRIRLDPKRLKWAPIFAQIWNSSKKKKK